MIINIRIEEISDFGSVYQLNKAAFGRDTESKLVDRLRKSEAFIPDLSLVAELDNIVIGFIMFTAIKIIDSSGISYSSLALAPMSVSPEYQKRGIGEQLVWHGLSRAKQLGHSSVIVLGHENYYPRFGFVSASKWNIQPPFEVPDNVFMGLELLKGGLEGVSGTVQYAREFEEVT